MISTSEGDVFTPDDWPGCMFTRDYRDRTYVTFNLRYDAGALVQHLPVGNLEELRATRKTEYDGYIYRVFANKELSIRSGKHRIVIYDMLSFFNCSLKNAAETYLTIRKLESDTNSYTPEYVSANHHSIANYCVRDSEIVRDLANIIIDTFNDFGVNPRKLISTAYVSWQWFRTHVEPNLVDMLYYNYPGVLQGAVNSYHGGKFEITRRGPGKYYEYDIVSAYPFEIAKLLPFRNSRPLVGIRNDIDGGYVFAEVSLNVPVDASSPIVFKHKETCVFPSGRFRRWITGPELEYAENRGWVEDIHTSYTIPPSSQQPLYKSSIEELMKWKDKYKQNGDRMRYQAVKILLNSLYGKFAQLIPEEGKIQAGTSWNPIFAAYITARTRIRIAEMQERFPSICAVHTDSLIATTPLPIVTGSNLGDWETQPSGDGVLFACGIYQIGKKSKFRGFSTKKPLLDMMPYSGEKWRVTATAPHSWREVAFRGMELDQINRFVEQTKEVPVYGDAKRLWLNDWEDFSDVRVRNVTSTTRLAHLL